jgi:hypothetical protein
MFIGGNGPKLNVTQATQRHVEVTLALIAQKRGW